MLQRATKSFLAFRSAYGINHIQSVWDARTKYQAQKLYDEGKVVQTTDRIYKPTYQIEFNREGEVLLYSCDPIKHSPVYLKYPYVMYEFAFPAAVWMWFNNPLGVDWFFNNLMLYASTCLWVPRMWYWRTLQYKISRLSLLRGGKFVKMELQTLAGDRNINWVENFQMNPLT